MSHERDDFRCLVLDDLRLRGYTIVEAGSDVSDPFHWWVIAVKDGYEVRVEERARALVGG